MWISQLKFEKRSFWGVIAALFGFSGVAFGAFGAHLLKEALTAPLLDVWKTAVFYQLVHTPVILLLSFLPERFNRPLPYFAAGTALFSFSLYFLALTGIRLASLITPIGGVLLLAGWGNLAWQVFRQPPDA